MLESFFIVLALISVLCAWVLYTGGRYGMAASNPWWAVIGLMAVLLNLHVIGLLLPSFAILPWILIAVAIATSLLAALREISFWNAGLLKRPGNRELFMEIILIVVSIYAAINVDEQLPDVDRGPIIAAIITPLLMVRWAITRITAQRSDRY
ncbi:MAG: hypothetical protein F4X20_04405 [Dehalococcoidia bacterium]|nr:hypothetical protein [Dehalococcoidia bacterium]